LKWEKYSSQAEWESIYADILIADNGAALLPIKLNPESGEAFIRNNL
jgi:hypothetical protein